MPKFRLSNRRGAAAVLMVVLLLVVGLIILGFVHGSARDQDLTVRHLESIQSFYAAEAGMNMAVREMMVGVDEDGDGTIGSISDDADSGTDPSIGGGKVYVTESTVASLTTLTSKGSAGLARREIKARGQTPVELTVEPGERTGREEVGGEVAGGQRAGRLERL